MARLFQYKKFVNSNELEFIQGFIKINKDDNKTTKLDYIKNTKNNDFINENEQKIIKNNEIFYISYKEEQCKRNNFNFYKNDYYRENKIYNRNTEINIEQKIKNESNETTGTTETDKTATKETKTAEATTTTKTTILGKEKITRKRNHYKFYSFMKKFLKRTFHTRNFNLDLDPIYVEFPNCVEVINNNLGYQRNHLHHNQYHQRQRQRQHQPHYHHHYHLNNPCQNHYYCINQSKTTNNSNIVMQDVRIRVQQQPTHGSPNVNRRPIHLFPQTNLNNCDDNEQVPRSPSSEEDNSPTEMNNCRRLVDKPPLVKRLTMGLLRSTEESRPLVHNTSPSINSGSSQTISDGYVNEGICEPEKLISSKFGDSCRQSLTTIPLENGHHLHDNSEFNFKKKYLRETSSANSSPKIFAPSAPIRIDSLSPSEQNELKGAAWFQAGIPREISLEVLSRQSPGAFLVRQSSTKPGCFALSLRVPPPAPKVAHYLILRTPRGYKIKGFTKEFSSLRALITHHSVMPELLPVPLSLPRPTQTIPPRRDLDDFDTYGSLNDFRKMMSDLNV